MINSNLAIKSKMILSTQSASVQGIDLMQKDNLQQFTASIKSFDLAYSKMEVGLSIIGTQPNKVLFSGTYFNKLIGLNESESSTLDFADWFMQESDNEIRKLVDALLPMLHKLAASNDSTGRSYIQMDYSRVITERQTIRVDERITPLYFMQKHPKNLFWCTTRAVDHLRLPFGFQLLLIVDGKVVEKASFCPPFHRHPMMQLLSPTERKVLQKLLDYKESKGIAEELNMGIETIRSHRKSIIRKTGFRSTDAAVEILRRDFFG